MHLEEGHSSDVLPFEGFPVPIRQGTLSAVIFSDETAEIVFVKSLIRAWPGRAVYLEPGRRFSGQGLDNLSYGRVYDVEAVYEEVKSAAEGSLIVISGAPLLRNFAADSVMSLRALLDEGDLTVVMYHLPLSINELDLASEFRRYYHVPELMDYLLAMRTSSYRGHYRMSLTVMRAPYDFVGLLGDHVFSVDGALREVLG
ncbi:MAG: hypothetical protein GXO14_03890 [Thermococci archaeon]|nr:hypothetical protein [Thermococci archaeon]